MICAMVLIWVRFTSLKGALRTPIRYEVYEQLFLKGSYAIIIK